MFANVNYEISDQEYPPPSPLLLFFITYNFRYANNEVNDPFAQMFIAELAGTVKPFCDNFTPTNYDLFIHQLANAVSF